MKQKRSAVKTESKADYFRVSLTLPKELDVYLEGIGSDAKSKGGFKLAKTTIIRAMIRSMMKMKIDLNGVKDERELENRINSAAKKK